MHQCRRYLGYVSSDHMACSLEQVLQVLPAGLPRQVAHMHLIQGVRKWHREEQ